jgi:hypothetical protein
MNIRNPEYRNIRGSLPLRPLKHLDYRLCRILILACAFAQSDVGAAVPKGPLATASTQQLGALSAQILKQPSRLELHPLGTNTAKGGATEWEVFLRSANGDMVAAPSPFPIEVGSGDSPASRIVFPAGATSVKVNLPVTNTGFTTVHATSPLLTGAQAATYVRAGSTFNPPAKPSLQLVLNSDRAVANGRDFVRVQAIVVGNPFPNPVVLRLVAVNATLEPELLRIPPGASSAEAKLTSVHSSKATVQCLNTTPPMEVRNARLSVDFLPDIHPALMVSPTNIWLLENAALTVTLLDSTGRVIKAKEAQRVDLGVKSGHPGELASNSIVILPDNSVASTVFNPYWSGPVEFIASVAESAPLSATLHVRTPWPVIWMSLFCGAIGGLIAAWHQKVGRKDFKWRVLVGSVTGFVLFVASAFGLLLGGLRGFSIHMLGATVVSLVGGYSGTEVLTLLIRRFDLATDQAPKGAKHPWVAKQLTK